MKAKAALPSLRKPYLSRQAIVEHACHWAIEQVTGERLPPLEPLPAELPSLGGGWFLLPNE